MERKARVIAFYLPQFHPTTENDAWWGKGFTEWTNVGKAKPLFRGHYQPRVPADLGYYDLRMPEVRKAQADMAREYGVEGFCYWHYWFGGGKRLLERPFDEVVESGEPDFPFCLGWANHSWTNKTWEKGNSKINEGMLMEQTYGESDYELHFRTMLPALKDPRYIRVDGKPLFLVYEPLSIPNPRAFVDIWQRLARENGIAEGIHFVGVRQSMDLKEQTVGNAIGSKVENRAGQNYRDVLDAGFDAVNSFGYYRAEFLSRSVWDMMKRLTMRKLFGKFVVSRCKQKDINKHLYVPEDKWETVYPTLFPNWDRTARSGAKARVYTDSTPEVFRKQIEKAMNLIEGRDEEKKILFLRSWNEWAEGNYVEPDMKYGHGYLEVLRDCIIEK